MSNWIQDFVNGASNFMQGDVNRMAQSPTPQNAITGGILQNPGQFVQNAAGDVGNLVKSSIAIPGNVIKSVSQGTEPQDLQNLAGGIGNMYKGIAQHPYQSFLQHPVNTSLALAPAGGVISKFAPGADVSEAANTGGEATAANITDLPPINQTGSNPMITSDKTPAPDDAVAQYNSLFQVPRNIAQNMKIKPTTIINQLIDDGVTNKSLNELDAVAKNVTGDTGAFPTINRIILNDIKAPIDYSAATDAIPTSIETYLKGSPEGLINMVQNQIKRVMPSYPEGDVLNFGNQAYASDLFGSTQELDSLANMYIRKAYTDMGNLINPEYERAGEAIQEVSNNIKDSLDNAVSPEQYQMYKNDPRILQQLQRVPQPMAQRWLTDANQFRDGRTIQAPYVGLSNMIEDTKDSQIALFTKWTNQMQQAQMNNSGNIANKVVGGITHPANLAGNIAEKGIQNMLKPFADKSAEDVERMKTSGVSPSVTSSHFSLPLNAARNVFGTAKSTLPIIAEAQEQGNNNINNMSGNNQYTQPNPKSANTNNQAYHGAIIPQDNANIMPDPKTGKFALPQTPPQGTNIRHYMNSNDYQTQLRNLGNTYTYGTPQYNNQKTILDEQYAQDQKQADEVFKGNNVKNFMDNAPQYLNDGNSVQDTLINLPTGFWNGVSTAGSIRAYGDPNYAQQLQQIDDFNNEFSSAYESVTGKAPTENQLLSSANSPQQAAKKYVAMQQFLVGTYGKYLDPYLALTSATGTQTQQGTPQGYTNLPPIQQIQPDNANAIVGGTMPSTSLPPIIAIP